MPYKILILESVRDEAAVRRESRVRQIAALQEHTFEHAYISERPPVDQTQPMPARILQSQQKSLDEQALLSRLKERIGTSAPHILLVHSGALFHSYPEQVLFVLQTLKGAFPSLRIGFQPRSFEKYATLPFFEYSTEIRDLMRKVFAERPG